MNSLVSVIIPTHNRKKMVERLIISLLKSTYKKLEIIVVDDASNDGTFEYLRKRFGHNKIITVLSNKRNLFAAGTRNVGKKIAKGDYLLFVDDDNVVDSRMIEEMVKVFEQNSAIGEVGPVNYSYSQKNKVFWAGTARSMFTTRTHHITEIPKGEVSATPDVPNSYMVRARAVKKIKFNDFYGIMYEESDFAYKIRRLGYQIVVVKKAKIFHDAEEYSEDGQVKDYLYHFMEDPRRPYTFARNRVIFHKLYSTNFEFLFVLFFWIWVFTIYYIYKFLFYSGYGTFTLARRLFLSWKYFEGTITGVILSIIQK